MSEFKSTTPLPFDLDQVIFVYSGINGACCCGCSGKYSYAKAHRDLASLNRGYFVQDDEINDISVKLIVNKVKKAHEAGEALSFDSSDGLYSIVVGQRLYLVSVAL